MSEQPRLFTQEQLGATGPTGSSGTLETIALVAFFGTIIFCTVQAIMAPRRTFCAEQQQTGGSRKRD